MKEGKVEVLRHEDINLFIVTTGMWVFLFGFWFLFVFVFVLLTLILEYFLLLKGYL